jgi:ADP-L-glycero-D-manno-heptose 6-epimerase
MIVVTGGAGFIGSNLVKGLNALGRSDILVVDDLTDARKFKNIVDCQILDYIDKEDFLAKIKTEKPVSIKIDVVFHQGACSDTTEQNGSYLIRNNYEYSKNLFHYCMSEHIPFIYASSAAVYGVNKTCEENPLNEKPINMYGYSKYLFDQYIRKFLPEPKSQIVGLRYFNVYGPRENHKDKMASVIFQVANQLRQTEIIKLFGEYDGFKAGEQKRDFIYVDDVVKVNLWFWQHPEQSGIFNLGTGQCESFNTLAQLLLKYKKGKIEYLPFPEKLKGAYQSYTLANLNLLRNAGFNQPFLSLAEGIEKYQEWLKI